MTTILIGGDIFPGGNIQNAFISGNAQEIFHDLLDDILQADLSIVNLEAPLVSNETPIQKPGGVLSARAEAIRGFVAAKFHVLNLANNHSFDQGAKGLLETIHTIKEAGLACVGAGSDIEEANMPLITEINGERIVVYSMAEREYSMADHNTPGANPLDLINFVTAIRKHKRQGIFIVLIHGGKEFYPYPSPEMARRCRFMVEMGADSVICSHTHCPLPWEIYHDRPIIYGLGNFVFEPQNESLPSWYEGYLARLSIDKRRVHFEAIPYLQSQPMPGARKMDDGEMKRFFNEMEKKRDQLKDRAFLETIWLQYCQQQKNRYLSALFGYRNIMRKFQKLFLTILHSATEKQRSLLLVQCETHREILTTIFKNERKRD